MVDKIIATQVYNNKTTKNHWSTVTHTNKNLNLNKIKTLLQPNKIISILVHTNNTIIIISMIHTITTLVDDPYKKNITIMVQHTNKVTTNNN